MSAILQSYKNKYKVFFGLYCFIVYLCYMDLETIKSVLELMTELAKVKAENERLKNEIEFLRSLVKKENKTERVTLKDNGTFI
jgi:cell division protein FtsB